MSAQHETRRQDEANQIHCPCLSFLHTKLFLCLLLARKFVTEKCSSCCAPSICPVCHEHVLLHVLWRVVWPFFLCYYDCYVIVRGASYSVSGILGRFTVS